MDPDPRYILLGREHVREMAQASAQLRACAITAITRRGAGIPDRLWIIATGWPEPVRCLSSEEKRRRMVAEAEAAGLHAVPCVNLAAMLAPPLPHRAEVRE